MQFFLLKGVYAVLPFKGGICSSSFYRGYMQFFLLKGVYAVLPFKGVICSSFTGGICSSSF